MDNERLFIAPKIKVGFQSRTDTYTEKLAYVIYYDLKGVLRKEKSWESWRDKKIDPVEFDNVPTEGFVLNKKVGGGRSDWNTRQEYVRVYDPRNFEFEITVPNLLFILKECDCSRGKGLEGKFVYAWSGTTLVLLPVSSEEYRKSSGFTNLQIKKVKAKELIKGATYLTKRQEKLVYVDRRLKHNTVTNGGWRSAAAVELLYVFWDEDDQVFVFQKDVSKIAAVVSEEVVSNYAELVDLYYKSEFGSAPVRLFLHKQVTSDPSTSTWYSRYWSTEEVPGTFLHYRSHHLNNTPDANSVERVNKVTLQDSRVPGCTDKYLELTRSGGIRYRDGRHRYHSDQEIPWTEPTNLDLIVELASGSLYKVNMWGDLSPIGEKDG